MGDIDIVAVNDSFTKNFKKIIQIISSAVHENGTSKDKIMIETARRRVNLVSSADPFMLLEMVGSYLYKYRDVLYDNIDEFMSDPERFVRKEDLSQINTLGEKSSKEEIEVFNNMMSTMRTKWQSYSDAEKKTITGTLKKMLSAYCKYLQHNHA